MFELSATHSRKRVATVMGFALLLAGVWTGACDKSSSDSPSSSSDASASSSSSSRPRTASPDASPQTPRGTYIKDVEGPEPSEDTVLVEAGDIQVTFGDYRRFMRQRLLLGPRDDDGALPESMPRARRADPRAQRRAVRKLVRRAVVAREAERRGIEVTREEIRTALNDHERLSMFLPLLEGDSEVAPDVSTDSIPALPEGLGPENIEAMARHDVRERKLREALLDDIGTEQLWTLYRKRHDTVRLAFVERTNAPTPENVDAFVRRDRERGTSRIRTYFEEHRSRYRSPKMVKVGLLRIGSRANLDDSTWKRVARRLEESDDPSTLADELPLHYEPEAYFTRREHPDAFESSKGEVGVQQSGSRAPHVWHVQGWHEAESAELSRPIRRQIASRLMQQSVVPSVESKLERVLEIMRDVESGADGGLSEASLETLRTRLDEAGFELQTTRPFGRDRNNYVPSIGLAEPIFERAFELNAETPVPETPILARGDAYAIRLLDRSRPSRKAFEREQSSLRKRVVEQRRDRIVPRFVDDWLDAHDASFHVEPLRVAYGVLRKREPR